MPPLSDPVFQVDLAFWYITGFSFLLLFAITICMVVFVIRYRRTRHPAAADIRGNWKLELIWTLIPTGIALSMFAFGWSAYSGLRHVPDDAEEIEAIGQMFSWIFVYENGKETEGELVVPQGRPIHLSITSIDVLHSFYAPAFRIKVDAVSGMTTYAWFQPDEAGVFDILCTEFCGTGHADMHAVIRVIPEAAYAQWLEEEE